MTGRATASQIPRCVGPAQSSLHLGSNEVDDDDDNDDHDDDDYG